MRLARVCPNTKGWNGLSGGWKGAKSSSFPAKYLFGFDEWLTANTVQNLFPWMKKDVVYCIAFIQSYKKQHPSFNDFLELFVINQSGQRLVVGNIKSCVRLSQSECSTAYSYFVSNGRLAAMQQEINQLGSTHTQLINVPDPSDIVNCCFEYADFTLLKKPSMAQNQKLSRYSILFR